MQTLEVTDDQYAAIQSLREAISEDVVGEYGFVRERDAVQFLLDNLDDDAAVSVETTVESSATDDVAASVGAAIEGETDPHALEEVSYVEDESVTDDAEVEVEVDPDPETETGSDSMGELKGDSSDSEADAEERDDESDAMNEPDSGTDGDEIGVDASGGASGDADDDDMLDEMMSLLETHDDKWGEATSADYRYSVELPDGTTEQVQTKDDVRALLFKNYR